MILFDTPNEDILRVMLGEWEKVVHFVDKTHGKAVKHFRSLRPPYENNLFIQRYTIPASNNTYTVVSKLGTDDCLDVWFYLKTDGAYGMRKFITLKRNERGKDNLPFTPAWTLDIFTGHFLSRYRERTGAGSRTADELFVQFLERNARRGLGIPAHLVNPAIDKNDDRQYAVISDEGLSFVEYEEIVLNGIKVAVNENKTFVAKDNLYYQQAVSLHASDWFVTRAKLLKAQKDGASADRLVKILDDGIFSPARQP